MAEISNPRRILAVSLVDAAEVLSRVITGLTGTSPIPSDATTTSAEPTSLAGTTHTLALTTPYYSAAVPVWLDLVSSPTEWAASFLSPEAKEVLAVLGGVVVVFPLSSPPSSSSSQTPQWSVAEKEKNKKESRDLIANVGKVVREGLGGWEWDGVLLAVGVGAAAATTGGESEEDHDEILDEWEDCCAEWGLEFVHAADVATATAGSGAGAAAAAAAAARNEFGEKMGIPRVLEALQSNDWTSLEADEDEGTEGGAGDDEDMDMDFVVDPEDFEGLRKAIWSSGKGTGEFEDEELELMRASISGSAAAGGKNAEKGEGGGGNEHMDMELGDEEVQKLERMMLKLQAVKDRSAGLPEEQRKRLAKQAVDEVMKEL